MRLLALSAEIVPTEQEYLRIRLLKEIDSFWSDYLEILSKIRTLVSVKVYLPQDPQEAFFAETVNLFQKGFQRLNARLSEITYQ